MKGFFDIDAGFIKDLLVRNTYFFRSYQKLSAITRESKASSVSMILRYNESSNELTTRAPLARSQ